jgi:acyl-coenzyme A synthetase/AMP-(fatty) acid ligase
VAPHRCLGVPQPFAEVAVLRPDDTPAETGEVGLLGVKGPTVTPGYWNDPDKTYRSLLNGYWLSGDLVYRDEADRFYHLDRVTDAIGTADGMVHSVLTEEILLAHLPEINDCVVVAAERAGEVCAIALSTSATDTAPTECWSGSTRSWTVLVSRHSPISTRRT